MPSSVPPLPSSAAPLLHPPSPSSSLQQESSMTSPKKQKLANMDSTVHSDIIEVEEYVVKTIQNFQYWLPDLKLTEADKKLLLNPLSWLNDNIINAAQRLLKQSCPEISGFQDVTCGVALSFSLYKF